MIHETIDKFLNSTPRKKTFIVGGIVLFIIAVLAFTFWLGTVKSREWADSEFLQEREKNLLKAHDLEVKANFHLEEAQKYAKENETLKREHEALAEILKANDVRLAGDAKKFTELMEQRNKRMSEIDSQTDETEIVCGICEDSRKSGFPLSDSFCARCKNEIR